MADWRVYPPVEILAAAAAAAVLSVWSRSFRLFCFRHNHVSCHSLNTRSYFGRGSSSHRSHPTAIFCIEYNWFFGIVGCGRDQAVN